ncbi:CopG family ribbon-helix-helix protein [Halonotius pteroides]|uniref:Putative nickel-responsive regulator n=1 Tax=Halonotius pteroides TaxID=268735 RepID=A0A3A6PZ95_9EURY|nr:CopG family ribbon-helix-helix protein [Halonotius pteroides]RJX47934.1 nickel-responsive transcriptional regulator NikR [Halonotius pteroides]
MSVVSISMPEALLERIDGFADEHGYSGRSEVVREGTRTLLEEFQGRNIDGQKHMCTVTVVFEYCQPAVQQRLTGVRHEYDTIVSATTHAHVQDQYCMELFVVEGAMEALSGFVNTVRAVPDVRAVDYSITSLGGDRIDQHIES